MEVEDREEEEREAEENENENVVSAKEVNEKEKEDMSDRRESGQIHYFFIIIIYYFHYSTFPMSAEKTPPSSLTPVQQIQLGYMQELCKQLRVAADRAQHRVLLAKRALRLAKDATREAQRMAREVRNLRDDAMRAEKHALELLAASAPSLPPLIPAPLCSSEEEEQEQVTTCNSLNISLPVQHCADVMQTS